MRRILLAIALLLAASLSTAGTITRGTKSATGTTAFGDATVIVASEVNTDFDTIYNLVNGNIDNANIDASAAIAYSKLALTDSILNADVNSAAAIALSKIAFASNSVDADYIDDYSTDEDEQDNQTTPGTSISPSVATTLEEEIARLRYVIARMAIGTSATAVATGGGTDTQAYWVDGPVRGSNLLYNGGFDAMGTLADNTNGDGWNADDVGTLAAENLVESQGMGDGQGINIIADGATEGVNQVLDGLKADTLYLAMVAAKPDSGECRLSTLGADTNQLSVTSADGGGAWEVLSGIFETDSTPSNVTINLHAVATTDDCIFDHAAVYEINTDPMPRAGKVVQSDTSTSAQAWTSTPTAITGLSVAVTPPGPGYIITVHAMATGEEDSTANALFTAQIAQNGTGVGQVVGQALNNNDITTASVTYINPSPTPGTTYTYTVLADEISGAVKHNETDGSTIYVTMEPAG